MFNLIAPVRTVKVKALNHSTVFFDDATGIPRAGWAELVGPMPAVGSEWIIHSDKFTAVKIERSEYH